MPSACFAMNDAIINMQYDNGRAERLNERKSFDPTKLDEKSVLPTKPSMISVEA